MNRSNVLIGQTGPKRLIVINPAEKVFGYALDIAYLLRINIVLKSIKQISLFLKSLVTLSHVLYGLNGDSIANAVLLVGLANVNESGIASMATLVKVRIFKTIFVINTAVPA